MKLCNETVTVFNKKLNSEKGWNSYIPTVIHGVSWYCEIASVVDGSGLHAANHFTIRIPEDADTGNKSYADPITYADEPISSGLWTLANGDILVKAEVTDDTLTPAQIHATSSDCCTVLGVTDNRRAPNAPHFKVVGS